MIFCFGFIGIFYALLILYLLFGFGKVKILNASEAEASTSFSIIIAFRNEAENLPKLFSSLKNLRYPPHLFEIVLVNDFSSDASLAACETFQRENGKLNVVIVQNNEAGKKAAIKTGISISENNYILTTDADCRVPPRWLHEMNNCIIENDAKLIAGPVVFSEEKGMLSIFQQIDFMSLQGATMGGFGVERPFLCNAANLCYEKQSFLSLDPFTENENIASGDDIFLLEKMKTAGLKTCFLKSENAIVETLPQQSFLQLINQRVRWAAKTKMSSNPFSKLVGTVVLLMNFSLILSGILVLLKILPQEIFLFPAFLKFNIDFLLIYKSAAFFKKEKILKNYFWCSILYPFFTSYVAFKALFGGYSWKGREFKM